MKKVTTTAIRRTGKSEVEKRTIGFDLGDGSSYPSAGAGGGIKSKSSWEGKNKSLNARLGDCVKRLVPSIADGSKVD